MDDRITLRLTRSQAERLEEIATRYQMPAAEVLRQAFERFCEALPALAASAPELSTSTPSSVSAMADDTTQALPDRSASRPEPQKRCGHPGQSLGMARLLARIAARSQPLPQPAPGEPGEPAVSTPHIAGGG